MRKRRKRKRRKEVGKDEEKRIVREKQRSTLPYIEYVVHDGSERGKETMTTEQNSVHEGHP